MFYNTASLALDRILLKRESVKSVILRHKKDVKLLYKVICQTLKYKQVIETILQSAQLGLKIKHSLLLLLVHDLLFGKLLPCGKPLIFNHKTRLEAELAKLKIKRGCSTNQELLPDNAHFVLPRHVRLNPLLTNTFDFLDHFDSYSLTSVLSSKRAIQMDQHVPNLFIFPPSTDFHSDAFLLEGKIILQDKASCFPAIVLNPPAGSVVIDACAAPGYF
jgi:putative methyltransferase